MIARVAAAFWSMLRNPQRMPARSWSTELFARALHRLFVESSNHKVDWLRRELDKAGAFHPAMLKTSFSEREVGGVPATMVSPKRGASSKTVVIYFHGGGYVVGSPKGYKAILAQIALNSNSLVIAPDYRLAPEHPYPAPQNDCAAITMSVQSAYPDYNIVLAGDSAGGALALNTALKVAQNGKPVDALVLLSPWVDPSASGGTMLSNSNNDFLIDSFLVKGHDALMQGQEAAPAMTHFVDPDLHQTLGPLPKTLVQCGEGELFFDQIQTFSAQSMQAGTNLELENYRGQFHVFQLLSPILKDARQAMRSITDFINRV